MNTSLLALAGLILISCAPANDASVRSDAQVAEQVSDIRRQVGALQSEVTALKQDLDRQQESSRLRDTREFLQRTGKLSIPYTTLPTDTTAFQVVPTQYGTLYVSVQGSEPHLDGQKVRLAIGNPLTATFKHVGISVQYGPRQPEQVESTAEFVARGMEWEKSLHVIDASLSEDLDGGRWSMVEVVIPAAPTKDIGYLAVRLDPSVVNLLGAK